MTDRSMGWRCLAMGLVIKEKMRASTNSLIDLFPSFSGLVGGVGILSSSVGFSSGSAIPVVDLESVSR